MHAKIVLAALLASLSAPVLAAPAGPIRCADDGEGGACVWGRAEGFDGASVQLRGLRIVLVGITVPSRKELCANKATKEEFDCARPARKRMAELVGRGVACDIWDVAGDRLAGRCKVYDGDLGRLLVAAGTARAAKDGPYESDQAAAMAGHRGLWQPDIMVPKEWEALRRKGDKAAE